MMYGRFNSFTKGIIAGMMVGAAITMMSNTDMRKDTMRNMNKQFCKAKRSMGHMMSNWM